MFAVTGVSDVNGRQLAVHAVAVVLAGGNFASDRAVDVHLIHLLSPIMRRFGRVY